MVDPSLTGPSSPYPEDVKEKAKKILSDMPGNSAGSYTHTKGKFIGYHFIPTSPYFKLKDLNFLHVGIGVIREQIAKMIQGKYT